MASRFGPRPKPLAERFDRFVFPEPMSGCWLWIGAKSNRGYGVIGTGPHCIETAHRVSWQIHRGEIPLGLWVLHKCDVRACVNPDHLYLGTVLENSRDLWARGNPTSWKTSVWQNPAAIARRTAALPRGERWRRLHG